MPVPSASAYTMSAGASMSSFPPTSLSLANVTAFAPCASTISLMTSGDSANGCARANSRDASPWGWLTAYRIASAHRAGVYRPQSPRRSSKG